MDRIPMTREGYEKRKAKLDHMQAFEMPEVTKRIATAREMGAEVTIVEMLDRILPVEDEEVSAFMMKALTKQGMKILVSSGVEKIDAGTSGLSATLKGGEAQDFSHVIVAVGIAPNSENIGLEALGVWWMRRILRAGSFL